MRALLPQLGRRPRVESDAGTFGPVPVRIRALTMWAMVVIGQSGATRTTHTSLREAFRCFSANYDHKTAVLGSLTGFREVREEHCA